MTPIPHGQADTRDRRDRADDRASLLRAWRDGGDVGALDALLRVELEPVKRSFRRRLRCYARSPSRDTSDYVDEAVARMLVQSPAPVFDEPARLRSYLTRAAVNLFVNHYHAVKRTPRRVTLDDLSALLDPSVRRDEDDVELRELVDVLHLSLNLLDEHDAWLLQRHLLEGDSLRAIAAETGRPKSTLARRVETAKANLVLMMLRWRRWMND